MTTRSSTRIAILMLTGAAGVAGACGAAVAQSAPPPTCVGDIDGDGATNAADFSILAGAFGSAVTPYTSGDLNGDGTVDSGDFIILAGAYGCRSIVQFIRYEIRDIGSLDPNEQPGDYTGVNALGLNEHGDVTGIAYDGPWPIGNDHPFRYDYATGQMIQIGVDVSGKGINDNGAVVGYWMQPWPGGSGYEAVPFIAEPGQPMRNLNTAYLGSGEAWGINNANQACASPGGGAYFIEADGTQTRIKLPGGRDGGRAWEINNSGVVTGAAYPAVGQAHCYRYDSATGTTTDLHVSRWRSSEGYGINDRGDVAGWAIENVTLWGPAVVWSADGDLIEFGLQTFGSGYTSEYAEHVNMQGDVVGRAISGSIQPAVGWVSFGAVNAAYAGRYSDPNRPKQHLLLDISTPESQAYWTKIQCFEINDARQITGIGTNLYDVPRGFLADPAPIVPGDLNLDGLVSSADMDVLTAHLGKVGARPLEGDINRDRIVDATDVALLNALIPGS